MDIDLDKIFFVNFFQFELLLQQLLLFGISRQRKRLAAHDYIWQLFTRFQSALKHHILLPLLKGLVALDRPVLPLFFYFVHKLFHLHHVMRSEVLEL